MSGLSSPRMGALPGWYPDPAGGGGRRYWDGASWHAAVPASKPGSTMPGRIVIGVTIGAVVLGIGAACIAGAQNVAEHSSGTTYPGDWKCIDATPVKDGACLVSGGGLLDTGLSAGWIRSGGPRADSATCAWRRLDGPSTTHIIDAGSASGTVEVHIQVGDYAFWSQGCQPWQHIG